MEKENYNFELNGNENTAYENLQDVANGVFRRGIIALSTYI